MFSPTWRRAKEPVHPEIWSHFQKTNKDGQVLKFRIQTMTDEYKEDVMDLVENVFMKEETYHSTSGCYKCPEYKELLRHYAQEVLFKHDATLLCVLDTEDEKPKLVGINLCAVCVDGETMDLSEITHSEAGAIIIKMLFKTKEMLPSVFETHNVKEYLGSLALAVWPEYRGMNISVDLLQARAKLCKELGFKITSAMFTGTISQKIATKAGFKEDGRILYEDIGKAIDFEIKTTSKYTIQMSLKVE